MQQFWQALRRVEPVFQTFRSRFRGKCSPVHFFWGAFDLAVSRFNGRRAPPRKGLVERDAYDEEVISLGFWPGDPWTGATEAMFYSYTVPEPPACPSAACAPTPRLVQRDDEGVRLAVRGRAPLCRPGAARSSSSRRARTTPGRRSPAGTGGPRVPVNLHAPALLAGVADFGARRPLPPLAPHRVRRSEDRVRVSFRAAARCEGPRSLRSLATKASSRRRARGPCHGPPPSS